MPFTKGFRPHSLLGHFSDHRNDFKADSPEQYEAMADSFMGEPLPCGVAEAVRCSNGDRLRYAPKTLAFGVVDRDGHILTFFKPQPYKHRQASNAEYFISECKA